ncbi:hypothetical protein KM192_01055 [Pediococcus pentosaceus]|uniref:hypothetical protein n=1 Tax=Pediococcus pentosaceus TaxID=1255 RepID=UPI001C92ECC0|nr:hypothetical protein [Pediococcus pentosaceus]MBY4581329.1 hypothetical protein [Pediococcus pentosaceus]
MWEHKWIDEYLFSTLPLLKFPKPMKIRFPVSGGTKWCVSFKTIDRQGDGSRHEYIVKVNR